MHALVVSYSLRDATPGEHAELCEQLAPAVAAVRGLTSTTWLTNTATGRHGAPLSVGGRGGVLHGAYSAIMQDEDGQILEAHSISAGLDYPGTGPEHAYLRDSGRARYVAVTDEEALATLQRVCRSAAAAPRARASYCERNVPDWRSLIS